MAVRVNYRRAVSYNTASNKIRKVFSTSLCNTKKKRNK